MPPHWLDKIANKELLRKTDRWRRRKWNWFRYTLRRSVDSIAKQALQWIQQ